MVDLTVFAVPIFIATMIGEAARLRHHPELKGYEARDTRASLTMGITNVLINLVMKGVQLAILTWFAGFARWHLDPHAWQSWAIGLVAVDFAYYWFHRMSHDVRLLWAAHVNHHSSEHYNLSTALRQSWTTPFTGLPFYWPLALAGLDPMMILALEAINTLYQYWIHTELVSTIGPLEAVFNTASHHRVHHGTNVEYLDRNHGGMFIVWDKLFGTFEPERAPVVYGLTKNIRTFRPLRIAFHEFAAIAADVRRAASVRDALGYMFAPPGWSPDGSTQTSRQLRRALEDDGGEMDALAA
ncbi:MAG TPA: sterol desaturase family protein [Candidatus Limnocylindrales bacterium]|nr:sterol desaturase family protein [Candidatus Limnocylindrales bacterium]